MTYNQDKHFTTNTNSTEIDSEIKMDSVDKIEHLLDLKDPIEMDNRIFKNSLTISKILRSFYKKLCDNFQISKEETDIMIYCLKFVDTLNLFMTNQSIESITKIIYDINELVIMINKLESKDIILKKIRYTEMTVVYYRKKFYKNLFFGDGNILGNEIEKSLELVIQNTHFDQNLFKQMQNIFWVVQSKIEENYRKDIQAKFNEMKAISLKSRKSKFNFYEDYDDYADYKNYSHTDKNYYYDYYDNFNSNNSGGSNANEAYWQGDFKYKNYYNEYGNDGYNVKDGYDY